MVLYDEQTISSLAEKVPGDIFCNPQCYASYTHKAELAKIRGNITPAADAEENEEEGEGKQQGSAGSFSSRKKK